MTMALPHGTRPAVELTYAGPIAVLLEQCRAQPEAHGSTHVSTGDLRHEYDDWVRWFSEKLGRLGACAKST
jgi:hypothetical protein